MEASEICFPLSLRLLKAIWLSSCRLTARAFPEPLQCKYGILRARAQIIIGINKQPKFQRLAVIIDAPRVDCVPFVLSRCLGC